MNEQENGQMPEQKESASEMANRYMTDEERQNWTGLGEWRDPLERDLRPPENVCDGKLAVASLCCGLAAALTVCAPIASAVFGVAALVCGIIAKVRQAGMGKASTVGMVLGAVGIGVALVLSCFRIMNGLFPAEEVEKSFIPSEYAEELE